MPDEILVHYAHPPIAEVVAAVSFDRLPEGASVHFGAFWHSRLRTTFPNVQEKPPYIPPIERFGAEVFTPQISLSLEREFPSPRLWFLTEAGDELLQLQRDWFACNWRKVSEGAEYAHWPSRRSAFVRWYGALSEYVTDAGLGDLVARQCEVTYINHIEVGHAWKSHGDVSEIFRSLGRSQIPKFLERESARFGHEFLMVAEAGGPFGRLHVSATPAFKASDRTPIYVLELTARGAPKTPDLAGVVDFLDAGRQAIVLTFAAITSDEMQREWGKIE
jgi:uncharacterized protein (TIGR04255 family)